MKNSQIMPVLVLIVAAGFTSADVFFGYEITDAQIQSLYVLLTPLGLGGLVKHGYKTYINNKTNSNKITPEDVKKIKEYLKINDTK